jgi:hypothetical protein
VAISTNELWSSAECAQAWGVQTTTWLGYVSRGQAPPPLPLPDPSGSGPRRWAADQVRRFPRPGVGRSRASATPEAAELLARMQELAARMDELRTEQRELLAEGKRAGLEILAMSRALGISRQTAYSWLGNR